MACTSLVPANNMHRLVFRHAKNRWLAPVSGSGGPAATTDRDDCYTHMARRLYYCTVCTDGKPVCYPLLDGPDASSCPLHPLAASYFKTYLLWHLRMLPTCFTAACHLLQHSSARLVMQHQVKLATSMITIVITDYVRTGAPSAILQHINWFPCWLGCCSRPARFLLTDCRLLRSTAPLLVAEQPHCTTTKVCKHQ